MSAVRLANQFHDAVKLLNVVRLALVFIRSSMVWLFDIRRRVRLKPVVLPRNMSFAMSDFSIVRFSRNVKLPLEKAVGRTLEAEVFTISPFSTQFVHERSVARTPNLTSGSANANDDKLTNAKIN